MTIETLKFIADALESIGINYEFGQWSSAVKYPYFVGEYTESEPLTEDGLHEADFMLTGWTRGTWLDLETAKEKIERLFANSAQLLPSGNGLAVFYAGSFIIPQNEAELKSIQINLRIKEWKVN